MPYFFLPLSDARPTITGVSAEAVAHGGALSLTYAGAVTHAVIAAPAAVTHQVGGVPCGAAPRPVLLRPWRSVAA
jgi:hypothetical protein